MIATQVDIGRRIYLLMKRIFIQGFSTRQRGAKHPMTLTFLPRRIYQSTHNYSLQQTHLFDWISFLYFYEQVARKNCLNSI